ncbi:MAG: eukaryotic-like serine/threonine-protein kinase [Gammaproteobacteria bacterium]|nr:eukaryotic-like serine/threonine-protein kinase [Gammaproteobacteria bacterium]
MPDATAPVLLVVGGDTKRLQWLTHHVTSHWPNAQVTTAPAEDPTSLAGLVQERPPDAVILQVDFGNESAAREGLEYLVQILRAQPDLYCIVLAENGSEMSAVDAMKSGAKDYLPLARISRDSLLKAVAEPHARRRAAVDAAADALLAPGNEATHIRVPGYTIVKEISTSNFSSVFLARSERRRHNVVLKVMNRGTSPRELDDAERFQREYEIISSIEHRAIAEIYDFGTLPEHKYLAMEYIPCGDLRDRLRNPLSIDESLYYLRCIAEALRVIHVFGILHRDLKPANVMLREDNSPVLIDFGLARRSMEDAETTAVGQVLGSPYYISPEQSQGQRVDARTDLYSLGVMFYEMLTGQRPYNGLSAMAIMAQHAGAPVPILPSNVALQQALLDRLMAKRPEERYASADELLADLGPLVAAAVA